MSAQIIKTVLFGILAGAILFAIPFMIFRISIIFLTIGLVSRLFGWRRRLRWVHFHSDYRGYQGTHSYEKKESSKDNFQQNPKNI